MAETSTFDTWGEPIYANSMAPNGPAQISEAAKLAMGRGIRVFATLAALNLASGMQTDYLARVTNIPGALFRYDGAAWIMHGVARFPNSTARGAAITAPLTGWRTALDSTGLDYVFNGTRWRPTSAGLIPIIPQSVAGAGVVLGANGAVTFTTAATVSADGVFTADFDQYLLVLDVSAASAASQIFGRCRIAGVDDSATNYNEEFLYGATSTAIAAQFKAATSWQLTAGSGAVGHGVQVQLFGPAIANRLTKAFADSIDYDVSDSIIASRIALGNKNLNAVDGFTIYPNTGTITGVARWYGYNNN